MKKTLLVLVGLPGSGKTHFAENYCKMKTYYNHIEIDKLKEKRRRYNYKEIPVEEIIYRNYSKMCKVNVLDGLFLTTEDIIKAISVIEKQEAQDEVIIHYWKPDIEKCLYNDIGRRNADSEITIKNAKIEFPDIEKIKKELKLKDVKLVQHEIVKKPEYKTVTDKNHIILYDDKYIYSEKWSLGGCSNDCWGGTHQVDADEPEDFKELDKFLEEICPNITFLQYKRITKKCVETKEEYHPDYYGGGVTYAYYKCDVETLIDELKKEGLYDLESKTNN